MNWINTHISDEDILQHAENEHYTFQAELVTLQPIFGTHVFGNFEMNVTVFDKMNNIVDKFELNGLNGKFQGAKKQLEKLKEKALLKYN